MALTDFFYPRWKHSRAQVRLEAVRKMTMNADGDILRTIARSDTDGMVRAAAVERIDDEAFLAELLTGVTDSELAEITCRRLDDLRETAIFSAENTAARMNILEKIHSPDTLERIACGLDNVAVKLAAAERINDPERLCRITAENCGLKVGLSIIGRMDDPDMLARVAGAASNKKVARAAGEKRSRLAAAERRVTPSKTATDTAGLIRICEEMEAIPVDSVPVDSVPGGIRSALIDASMRWAAAAAEAEAAGAPLSHAAPDLLARYEAAAGRLESAAAAEDLSRRRKAVLTDLCRRADSLDTGAPEDLKARRAELEGEWAAAGGNAEKSALYSEFSDALDRAEARQKKKSAHADALASIRDAAENRLADLIRQAEAAGAPPPGTSPETATSAELRELREKLENDWNETLARTAESGPKARTASFRTALERLSCRISLQEEAEAAAVQAQETELRGLLAEMTALEHAGNQAGLDRRAREIREEWKSAGVLIPEIKDVLAPEFEEACSRFFAARRAFHEQKDWERWANATRKTELCELVERLTGDDLPAALGVIREAQKQWKETGPVDRDKSEALWDRFRTACDRFFLLGLAEKKRILARVEELVPPDLDAAFSRGSGPLEYADGTAMPGAGDTRPDDTGIADTPDAAPAFPSPGEMHWKTTGNVLKELQGKWKAIGPLPAAVEGDIFERFQDRCSVFFTARRRFYRNQDRQRKENLALKIALCTEAEALSGSDDWRTGLETIKSLQVRWKKTGPVPRQENEAVWERFRTACDHFFDGMKAHEPENLVRKTALCKTAESLLAEVTDDTDFGPVTDRFKSLQREWRHIGPVPKSEMAELNVRFRAACDAFFSRRNERREQTEADHAANEAQKTALADAAEAVSGTRDWKAAADTLKRLQQEWKEIGPASRAADARLWRRFRTACDSFFQDRNAYFSEQKARREANGRRKEDICIAVESLAQLVLSGEEQADMDDTARTAVHLRMGLEFKETVVVPGNPGATRSRAVSRIRDYQKEWKEIGPAPRSKEDVLWQRFRKAADSFFAPRNQDSPSGKAEKEENENSS